MVRHTPTLAAPNRRRWWVGWTVGAGLLVGWSWWGTGIDPVAFVRDGGQVMAYLRDLYPPDLSETTLRSLIVAAAETLAMSFLGTLIAVALAAPLAIAASSNVSLTGVLHRVGQQGTVARSVRWTVYLASRGLLNLFRTVPDLIWAMIFILAVGLGPFAGVLALGIHTAGVLGKLFGEVLENVREEPLEALLATGAGTAAILGYGFLPQALPQAVTYILYRWEVNIRAAAIIGFIGAGGLGLKLRLAVNLFHFHELATILLILYGLITLVDRVSAAIRPRVT